ncbi:MAG: hypothetical protein ABFE16_19125 [Armatimonadia bacterium]
MTSAKLGVPVAIALVCALGACQPQTGDQPGQPQSQATEPGGASAQPNNEATTPQSSTAEPAASAAQEGTQATSTAKRSPEQIVADFLQCKPEDLTLKREEGGAKSSPSHGAFRFELGAATQQRETGSVVVDVERGFVTQLRFASRFPREAGMKSTPELDVRCRKLAEPWLARVCPLKRDRLGDGETTVMGGRTYCIRWEEGAGEPGVWTGSRVLMGFDMTRGQLVSYLLRVAPTKVPKPKLGEAEARREAEAVARKLGEQYSVGPDARLVLSSAYAPEEGPTWEFTLHHGTGTDAVVIDAVKGSEVKPGWTAPTVPR